MTLYATRESAEAMAMKLEIDTLVPHEVIGCAADGRFAVIPEKCECGRKRKVASHNKCYLCGIEELKEKKDGRGKN